MWSFVRRPINRLIDRPTVYEHPPRAHVALDVLHLALGDLVEVVRSVDELPVARVYSDVGDAPTMLVEEDQVTGLLLAFGDPEAHTVLLVVPVRQRNAEPLVNH